RDPLYARGAYPLLAIRDYVRQARSPSLEGLDVVELEGRLRAIHLMAHVRMRPVLTPEQVGRYDNQPG
ncbi:MAG: hypothetical protein LC797_11875, partial [Chloroflexi bacterium]|nr:hypothetical protein [Chloroflexota bacterium]